MGDHGPLLAHAIPLQFTGTAKEYFKIWIVNVGLTIMTLGVYSAWAKVRKKRYFYGNTWLEGTSFEYLGDPIKILKGRLIVAGIVVAYFVATNFLPAVEGYSWLLFIALLPWLVVKARTFNARNSAYRNLRFDFRATWDEAYAIFFGLPFLAAVTGGLAYPYFACRRSEFVASHTRYGTTPFVLSWRDKVKTFYTIYVAAFFVSLASVIGFAFVFGLLIIGVAGFVTAVFDASNPLGAFGWMEFILLCIVLFPLVNSVYVRSRVTNFIWSNTTLGNHRFASSLKTDEMIWLYVSNAVAILLSLGLLTPWATIRTLRYRLDHFKFLATSDLDEFVAGQQDKLSAAGEEISEFYDVDVGL